ncbi:alpha/beta-hydrolase [Exidia glandulosa HHB12029]|uniref:Alpha/beta-hydrolase n=1 Tax=Exidia glandulosa HHB12029 TaxID=1314781 RepID=A0A165B541_EXIGL|nr:alpha/beta-hydrolase [Exidia glandulosa HHB12029]
MITLSWYGWLRLRLWFAFRNGLIRLWLRRGPPRSGLLPPDADIRPTLSIRVPSSSDKGRSIRANIFYPPGATPGNAEKLPVHLHVHGSGFCYKTFPADTELAAYIAQKAGCIVVDTDYAKAPEHPFPAGYNDVVDVTHYILSRPDDWDLSRFTMGGASSGACLAMSAAVHQPKGTVKGLITLYPPVDLSLHPHGAKLVPPVPKGNPGFPLSVWERSRFMEAYLSDNLNREDPRLSPIYAPVEAFPPVTIICGDCDPLLPNAERFVAKLRQAGNDVEQMLIEGVGHGWERMVKKGTKFEKLRDESMAFFISRLQACWKQ